jgi:ATP-binding cassette subfamily B protein
MKNKDIHYLKRYWACLRVYKGLLALAFVLIPLLTVVHLMQPYLLKVGIDTYILTKDISGLYKLSMSFAVVVVLEFIFRSMQSYLFQYIGQKTVTAMRSDLFRHILSLSSSYFDQTPVGQMTTRLTSDMESLNESFSSGMVTLLSDLLIVVSIIGVMFYLNAPLTCVVLVFVPLIVVVLNFFRKKLRSYFARMRDTMGHLNALLQEQLQGVHVIQMFRRESKNDQEFEQYNREFRKTVIASVSYDAILYSFVEALSSVVIAVLIWAVFDDYLGGSAITLGLLVAFIDYVQKLFAPLKDLSSKFTFLQNALASLEKIFGAFDVDEHILSGKKSIENFSGDIRFEKVHFAYPGYEDKPILKDISFEMKPKQVVALVGPTGSGKTSVSRLISRLYDGYEGQIFLDNVEIRELNLAQLRSKIAVVLQDLYMLSRSVAFNITLGNPHITKEQMIHAAELAQVDTFIRKLPQGYETLLDHKNNSLSQGEAQLISFARALASDAPIVLFDEATSSVDSINEQLIQRSVDNLLKKKTVLVIAHRLSTIQKADLILALKDGKIIERGTHEELLAIDGFYAKLFKMQFGHL